MPSSQPLANGEMSPEQKDGLDVPLDLRLFHSQQAMFDVLDKFGGYPIAWDKAGGKKCYGVCVSKEDLFLKLSNMHEDDRHCYELIRENTPCCCYLDMEW